MNKAICRNLPTNNTYIWKGSGKDDCAFTPGKLYPCSPDGKIKTDNGVSHAVDYFDDMVLATPKEIAYTQLKATYGKYSIPSIDPIPTSTKGEDTSQLEEGTRYNSGKPELSFILQGEKGLTGLAQVLEFGGRKYDRGNWLKGLPPTEIIDSLMRHLVSYTGGEVIDPESGLPHIDHIHANAKFLAEHGDRDEK